MEAAAELRPLESGTMLDDKYRVERLLAVGGMGAVYEGTHTKLRKRVAIKVLNRALASQAMLDRFHREAITASQIGHEGIAQVTDLGTSTTGESFIVMELLEGEPLSARLRAAKQLPVEVACELGCAILSPLAAAHAAGVVHRDLKPDNVFLVRQSRGEMVKLLDFGISRAAGLEQEFRLTTTGLVLGTPYYMSPEQARGETAIGPAADLYSFGVIMYEMLVGEVPVKADNYNQLIYKVMTGDYARPRAKRPDLPPALEDLVLRAMALEPDARPRSATELEQALLAFCRPTFRDHMIERISQSAIGFKSSSPLLPAPAVPQAHDATVLVGTPAPGRRGVAKLPLVLAGIAAAGIAAAVIVAKQRSGSETRPAASAPSTASGPATPGTAAAPSTAPGTAAAASGTSSPGSPATASAPGTAAAPRTGPGTESGTAAAARTASPGSPATAAASGSPGSPSTASAPASPGSPGTTPGTASPGTASASGAAPARPGSSGTASVAGSPGSASAPGTAAGTGSPSPAAITLKFDVEPASATVTIDGKRVTGGALEVARDDAPHELAITAKGYQPYAEQLRFTETQKLVIKLDKIGKQKPRRQPKSGRTERIDTQSPYEN